MLAQTLADRRQPALHQSQVAKIVASLTAVYAAYRRMTPDSIEDALNVLALFIILDTLTGVWCAFVCRQAASKTLVSKLVTKCAQYALLLGLSGGAALLAHNLWIVQAGLLSLVAVESLSMLENLARLQKCGGVNMGPAQPLVDRLSKYLAVIPDAPGKGGRKEDDTHTSQG